MSNSGRKPENSDLNKLYKEYKEFLRRAVQGWYGDSTESSGALFNALGCGPHFNSDKMAAGAPVITPVFQT